MFLRGSGVINGRPRNRNGISSSLSPAVVRVALPDQHGWITQHLEILVHNFYRIMILFKDEQVSWEMIR